MVLNICRGCRLARPVVWFLEPGPIVEQFARSGIHSFVCGPPGIGKGEPGEIVEFLRRHDVMHIHCLKYFPKAHAIAAELGLACVVTLHGRASLPSLTCPVVCVSDAVARMQIESNEVHVIHNGIDLKEFRPKDSLDSERIVIIRVCRPKRCAPYFWESVSRVLSQHQKVELWIVGEEGNSSDRVKYLGVRSDVSALLGEADIFAYAPWPEQGSHDVCVLEAMATGIPCVLTDVTAVRESVSHMKEGLLVPFGDAQLFAEAVDNLVIDKSLRLTLGRNARRSAVDRFDIVKAAERYDRIYTKVIRDGPVPTCAALHC
jgi:glycosyltransferase involved in cell wall biosynthesis